MAPSFMSRLVNNVGPLLGLGLQLLGQEDFGFLYKELSKCCLGRVVLVEVFGSLRLGYLHPVEIEAHFEGLYLLSFFHTPTSDYMAHCCRSPRSNVVGFYLSQYRVLLLLMTQEPSYHASTWAGRGSSAQVRLCPKTWVFRY